MTIKNRAEVLYGALQKAGYSKAYVHRMLPDWWSDDLLKDASARIELDLMLSRMFGLRLSDLLKVIPEVSFDVPAGAKYKRSQRLDTHDLEGATSLVHSIAKMVATAVPVPFAPIADDPMAIRDEILSRLANRVSLMSVVGFLWECGIPTIHLSEMPAGLKKMDGLCLKIEERPVVILCKQTAYQAWLLFIIAHELAHIALGHVEPNEILVDYAVGEGSYLMADEDPEEMAADEFALGLLNGEPGVHYTSVQLANSAQLAAAALKHQEQHRVDAGHVILNFGHYNDAWPIAQAALKRLDKGNAPEVVNAFLFHNLSMNSLPRASMEYLLKVTGMVSPEDALL